MLGRPTSYSPRGLTTPRPGAFAARRPRSLLARAFAGNSPLRHMAWILVVVVLGLTAIGTLLIWSATEPGLDAAGQDPRTYLKKQLLNVAIGLVLMIGVSLGAVLLRRPRARPAGRAPPARIGGQRRAGLFLPAWRLPGRAERVRQGRA